MRTITSHKFEFIAMKTEGRALFTCDIQYNQFSGMHNFKREIIPI